MPQIGAQAPAGRKETWKTKQQAQIARHTAQSRAEVGQRAGRAGNQLWAGRAREGPRSSWWPRVLYTSALGLSRTPRLLHGRPGHRAASGPTFLRWCRVPGGPLPVVCSASSLAMEGVAGPGTQSPKAGSLAFMSPGAPFAAPACSGEQQALRKGPHPRAQTLLPASPATLLPARYLRDGRWGLLWVLLQYSLGGLAVGAPGASWGPWGWGGTPEEAGGSPAPGRLEQGAV